MRTAFEFTSGSLALDLVDTVSARRSAPLDLIPNCETAARWLAGAGFGPIPVNDAQAEEIRLLRESIFMVIDAVMSGVTVPRASLDHLNRLSGQGGFRPQWANGVLTYSADEPLRAALSDIAADALSNLEPAVLPRIRECEECRMLFRDRSKPGRRRWCSSSSGCGNRAKVRRHRERLKVNQTQEHSK